RPMTRERWERLAPLVDAVLDQPVERRQAYISEISGGAAPLAAELGRFVAAYGDDTKSQRRDGSIFELAGKERAELLSNDARRSSDMDTALQASLAATYVFKREIGGGGMSRVFVAEERGVGAEGVMKGLAPANTARDRR